jgi:hypothetical protein
VTSVESQPEEIVQETLSQKTKITKQGWRSGYSDKALA